LAPDGVAPAAGIPLGDPSAKSAGRAPDAAGRSARRLRTGAIGLAASLLLPQLLPGVNASYLIVAILACACASAIAWTEDPDHRLTSLNVFVWAMLVRVIAVTLCTSLGLREGGPFLGPDSTTYYRQSAWLASVAFHLDALPVVYFGSYDVSHYYLFATATRYLHTDLFGLQVMNCAMTALTASLVYGLARLVLPSWALALGLAVAFHPSLIAMSVVDLLKDPSIILGTVLIVWVIVRLTVEQTVSALPLYLIVGVAAALYVRTGRFYSFAYLEMAFVAAVLFMWLVRRKVFARPLAAVVVVIMFISAEVLPTYLAWPPSPIMVASNVSYVLDTPQMSQYAMGLFDRLKPTRLPNGLGLGGEGGPRMTSVHVGPTTGPLAIVGSLASFLANLVRRLYGPFVWILPSDWRFRALQAGDYLLYPGMLVWYGLLPLIGIGLCGTGWALLRRKETRFALVFLWFFATVYFAQYLAINLSYRQRDVMLPVLLVFACVGVPLLRQWPRWRAWYAGYAVVLVLVAVSHLMLRAFLHA
jgi:hypothetical protein